MLTFHSLLEGLALGSVSSVTAQEALALAILFHKDTDTFALAMTLGRWGVSSGRIFLATLFLSAASPGGAWLASRVDLSGPHLFHGILSAATAGTFLYLAGSDLLVPELKEAEGRAGKIVSAIFGFSVVVAATFAVTAQAQEPTGTLKKIKDTGAITIGHRESSIPFSYLDDKQQPIGYAMDLCMKIVDAVKAELKKFGRKKLVLAALWTEVCLNFPALEAMADGRAER